MSVFGIAILVAHFGLLLFLSLSGLHRLSLIARWLRHRHDVPQPQGRFDQLPRITVQVPLYNERFVAARVVDTMAALDYPRERLQIQILDDSTDDTSAIIAERIQHHLVNGVPIEHIRRQNRHGFKAGALADAMETATGEFIAIFDADFVPHAATLQDAINHFTDEAVGMVQLRWEHLNRQDSRLTRTQAIALDAHFGIEQWVRCATGVLFNFNGTAGIWRKQAIIDAGNWSADTLTEDLDLSYRAQLRGWKLCYLPHVNCPGEVPADMNAFKSQQHRWAKGAIEVMRKLLPTVWRSPLGLGCKLESTFHLANNLSYLLMMIDTVLLLVPSLIVRQYYDIGYTFWLDLPLLLLSSGGHLAYFLFGQVALGRSIWSTLGKTPALLLLGVQLAFNNARAAAEALMGHRSPFIRTPKQGDQPVVASLGDQLRASFYNAVKPKGAGVEVALGLAYGVVVIWAIANQLWPALPFLVLLNIGFLSTGIASVVTAQR